MCFKKFLGSVTEASFRSGQCDHISFPRSSVYGEPMWIIQKYRWKPIIFRVEDDYENDAMTMASDFYNMIPTTLKNKSKMFAACDVVHRSHVINGGTRHVSFCEMNEATNEHFVVLLTKSGHDVVFVNNRDECTMYCDGKVVGYSRDNDDNRGICITMARLLSEYVIKNVNDMEKYCKTRATTFRVEGQAGESGDTTDTQTHPGDKGVDEVKEDSAGSTEITQASGTSDSQVTAITNPKKFNYIDGGIHSFPNVTNRWIRVTTMDWTTEDAFGDVISYFDMPDLAIETNRKAGINLPFSQYLYSQPMVTMKVQSNSTRFMGGTIIIAVRYNDKKNVGDFVVHAAQLLSMPHVIIQASSENEAVLEVPFVNPLRMIPNIDCVVADGLYYFTVYIGVLNPLVVGDGSTRNVTLQLYVNFNDTTFAVQRRWEPKHSPCAPSSRAQVVNIKGQMMAGISGVLSNLSEVESLAEGLGSILRNNNHDRPTIMADRTTINIQSSPDMAIGDGPLDLISLRNKKSHLTPHPPGILPTQSKEYSLDYLCSVKNAIGTFAWETSSGRGTQLFDHIISPIQSLDTGANTVLLPTITETSCNFTYRTGSYVLTFMFGSSLQHSGRIIILTIPDDTNDPSIDDWYSYPFVIYDLAQQQIFEHYVPNVCPTHLTPIFLSAQGEITGIQGFGRIRIYVESPLKVLGAVSNVIYCTVMIHSAPDYRLYVPRQNNLIQIQGQSGGEVRTRREQTLHSLSQQDTIEHTIGESMSIYTLARRFQFISSTPISFTATGQIQRMEIDLRPGAIFTNVNHGARDFLGWLTEGMRFSKGSLRFIFQAPGCSIRLVHFPDNLPSSTSAVVNSGLFYQNAEHFNYANQITSGLVNDIVTFEVPYYNQLSFIVNNLDPATRNTDNIENWEHSKYSFGKLYVYMSPRVPQTFNTRLDIFRAAGDDFQMYCFQGFPIRPNTILNGAYNRYVSMLQQVETTSATLLFQQDSANNILFGIRPISSQNMIRGVYGVAYLINTASSVEFRANDNTNFSVVPGFVVNATGGSITLDLIRNGVTINTIPMTDGQQISINTISGFTVGVRYTSDPDPNGADTIINFTIPGAVVKYSNDGNTINTISSGSVARLSVRDSCVNIHGQDSQAFQYTAGRFFNYTGLFIQVVVTSAGTQIHRDLVLDQRSIPMNQLTGHTVTISSLDGPSTQQVEGQMCVYYRIKESEVKWEEAIEVERNIGIIKYDYTQDEQYIREEMDAKSVLYTLKKQGFINRLKRSELKQLNVENCIDKINRRAHFMKKMLMETDVSVIPNFEIISSFSDILSTINPMSTVNNAANSVVNTMNVVTSSVQHLIESIERKMTMLVPSLLSRVGLLVSILPNLYVMWFSSENNVVISAFISILITLGLITSQNIGMIFSALTACVSKIYGSITGQNEEVDKVNQIVEYFNVFFPMVVGCLGLSDYKSKQKSKFVYMTFFKDLFMTSNSISTFIRNNMKALSSFLHWVVKSKDPSIEAVAIIRDKKDEMVQWFDRAVQLTSGHNRERVFSSSSLQKELDILYRQATEYLAIIQDRRLPNASAFMGIYRRVSELHQAVGQRVGRGRLTIEPISVRLIGPAGIGKSVVLSHIMSEMLISFGIVFDGPAIFVRNFTEYWNGYNDQPAIIYDDFLQITEPTCQAQALQEFFSICTCAEFNAVMPAIEDKDRMVNPELIGTIMNNLPHALSGVSSLNAFKRRGDFTLMCEFDTQYLREKYGREFMGPEDPNIPEEALNNFEHLKLAFSNRFTGVREGPWMRLSECVKIMQEKGKAIREKRNKVALRRLTNTYSLTPRAWNQRLQEMTLDEATRATVESGLRALDSNLTLTQIIDNRDNNTIAPNCDICVMEDVDTTRYREYATTVVGPEVPTGKLGCICNRLVGESMFCFDTGCYVMRAPEGSELRELMTWTDAEGDEAFDVQNFEGDYYYLPFDKHCSSFCMSQSVEQRGRVFIRQFAVRFPGSPCPMSAWIDVWRYSTAWNIPLHRVLSDEMKQRLRDNEHLTANELVGQQNVPNSLGLSVEAMHRYEEYVQEIQQPIDTQRAWFAFWSRRRVIPQIVQQAPEARQIESMTQRFYNFIRQTVSINVLGSIVAILGACALYFIIFYVIFKIVSKIVTYLFPNCAWAKLLAEVYIRVLSAITFKKVVKQLISNVEKECVKEKQEKQQEASALIGNVGATSSGDPKTTKSAVRVAKMPVRVGQSNEVNDEIFTFFKNRSIELEGKNLIPETNTVGLKRFFGKRRVPYTQLIEELSAFAKAAYDEHQLPVKIALITTIEALPQMDMRLIQYLSLISNCVVVFVNNETFMDYEVIANEEGENLYTITHTDSEWLAQNDGKIHFISSNGEDVLVNTTEASTNGTKYKKWVKNFTISVGQAETPEIEIKDVEYMMPTEEIEQGVQMTKKNNKEKLERQVNELVRRHTVLLTVGDGSARMKVFIPFERYALMPFHYVKQLEKYVGQRAQVKYRMKDGSTLIHEIVLSDVLPTTKRINNLDLAVIHLPKQVPNLPNIIGMFADQHYASTAFKRNARLVDGCDLETMDLSIHHFDKVKFVQGEIAYEGINDILLLGYSYPYGKPGLCGAALICNRSNKILGFHTTGKVDGTEGYAMVCPNEIVKYLKELYLPIVRVEPEVIEDVETELEVEGQCEVIGVVPEKVALKPLIATMIYPSPCQGLLIEPQRFPLVFTSPGETFPGEYKLMQAFDKQCHPPKPFDTEKLKKVEDHLFEQLVVKCPPTVLKPREVHTVDEAILGMYGREFYNPMKLNTSPGWPLCSMYPGSTKKSFFEIDYENKHVTLKEPLQKLYVKQHRQRKQGEVPASVSANFAKDERRPIGKGVRIINGTPLQEYIDWRRYTAEFWLALQCSGLEIGSAIGVNAESTDWNEIAQRLIANSKRIITGDYTAFGPRVPQCVVYTVARLCERWYERFFKTTHESRMVRATLYEGIAVRLHILYNTIIKTFCGIDTGNPWTAILNTLCNKIMIMYIWEEIFDKTVYSDLFFFEVNTYDIYYGDDLLISIKEPFHEKFNNNTIRKAFAKYDVLFTDAHKRTNGPDTESITEASFLKRRFVMHPERMIYMAQLDETVVLDIVNWYREPCADVFEKISQDAIQICYFASSYGSDYYEYVIGRIRKWFSDHGIFISLPDYVTVDARFDGYEIDWSKAMNIF